MEEKISEMRREAAGKKVAVVGMGRTAVALARLLVREGARPFVTESSEGPKLGEAKSALDELGVEYETGGHTEAAFRDAEIVIPSPGVSPWLPAIEAAVKAGAELMSELEFAWPYCQSRIIAVTGTNGKTTTTEWIRAMIRGCGHSVGLAGNNALPLSAAVLERPAPLYLVLELSSYQLDLIKSFRPWIGVVLNVTPDHFARHGTIERYAAAKERMFKNMGEGDHAVVNLDDPWTRAMGERIRYAGVHGFSVCEKEMTVGGGCRCGDAATYLNEQNFWVDGEVIRKGKGEMCRVADVSLPGRHNLANALASLAVMDAGRFAWDRVRRSLFAFEGVEHRIEAVATINHVTYYNDSKSTNLDSLKVALESFDRPVVLIAGGEGKGSDYRVLSELVREKVKAIVTIGADAGLIAEAYGPVTRIVAAGDMDDAVKKTSEEAVAGDVVLLSPGCASFDMFDNFEHRGRVFKACVAEFASRTITNEGKNCPQIAQIRTD